MVFPLSEIVVGLNDTAITGGATTTRVAEAEPPVPPSWEVTAPVVLFICPATVPVTLTETVQEAPAAKDSPLRLI